jgi:glycosyltransferase involved in cell wall biosynthesis
MSEQPPDLTVVVPCYREGPTLTESLARLTAWLQRRGLRWELLLIDDASPDGTRALADGFVAAHPELPLRTAHHAANTGRGGAVADGLRLARGHYAGFLDIDLEISEAAIGPCLDALDAGADMVIGRRRYELEPHSLLRHVLSRGYAALVRAALGTRLQDTESGCKWFRREAILPVLGRVRDRGWFFDTEIAVRAERAGLAVAEVPVEFVRRFDKASTVRPLRDSAAYLASLLRFRARLFREG